MVDNNVDLKRVCVLNPDSIDSKKDVFYCTYCGQCKSMFFVNMFFSTHKKI